MKISLNLAGHCIETEVKRLHEAAISRYFKGKDDKAALEAELLLLEKALSGFDFHLLRGRWSMLSGGDDQPVFLTWDAIHRPCLQFDDRCVVPPAAETSV
jgi:hypothetical protein